MILRPCTVAGRPRTLDDAGETVKPLNSAAQKNASSVVRVEEDVHRLRNAIDERLDDEAKTILRLYFEQGLPLTEIASQVSLTYDKVRYKFRQSLNELERELT